MNNHISSLLYNLGITANYTGYHYITYAVELACRDPSRLNLVTKKLYPTVATHFSSTPGSVERTIRRSVDLAWQNNPQLLEDLAGYHLERRPYASQFIAMLTAECKKWLTVRPTHVDQLTFFK